MPRIVAGFGLAAAATDAASDATWSRIRPLFEPPPRYAGEFGSYASPLKFYDGRPVRSPAQWPDRREEILAYWHRAMGPWPTLLTRPRFTITETVEREGVTQHRLELEVAANVFQHGFLLLPAGGGRRPAVLVPFYAPEISVGYEGPTPLTGQAKRFADGGRWKNRDFAWQLARRGFVTLAIGSPGDDAFVPVLNGAVCQPLSYLAYIAANCHTALAQRPEVDRARTGVMGFSYGGKWAMFASCLYDKFACGVWSDGGLVFDESLGPVNYWEPWYLGLDPKMTRKPGVVKADNPRTGAYRQIVDAGHDLVELHALMAPRPFLVMGGNLDRPSCWTALNHAVAVNRFLGHEHRVAFNSRPDHTPTVASNEEAYLFLEHFLAPVHPAAAP